MADKVRIRLTIRPDEEIEVPPDEVAVLRHQGLLIEDAPGPKQEPKPAGKPADRAAGAPKE